MDEHPYEIRNAQEISSPALIYYREIIEANIHSMLSTAPAERLWPHVKTYKAGAVVELLVKQGLTRFKCATIAEAEMTAMYGARDVLLAYPLIGPYIQRFIHLHETYPQVCFWALGDNIEALKALGTAASEKGIEIPVLVDLNMGMDRTGVRPEGAEILYEACVKIPGIKTRGFHCYDGHLGIGDLKKREEAVQAEQHCLSTLKDSLVAKGYGDIILVAGGSPTFPCHARYEDCFLSPGTIVIHDYGYAKKFPDLMYKPGAAVLTRVISHPREDSFTLDLGYKAIAADQEGERGMLVGFPWAAPGPQSEEHWVFHMKPGKASLLPPLGAIFYVIPTHICPTSALYPSAWVAEHGRICESWNISARNRMITL